MFIDFLKRISNRDDHVGCWAHAVVHYGIGPFPTHDSLRNWELWLSGESNRELIGTQDILRDAWEEWA